MRKKAKINFKIKIENFKKILKKFFGKIKKNRNRRHRRGKNIAAAAAAESRLGKKIFPKFLGMNGNDAKFFGYSALKAQKAL